MSKVIRLSDSDLEIANNCFDTLNELKDLFDVPGFSPDLKFIISSALNCYKNYLDDKFGEIQKIYDYR